MVEDDAFTRSTLVGALEFEGFEVLGPADGAAAAVASFNRHNHDVVLADLDLGSGPSGIELAWLLRKTKPGIGIVFLTSFEDPRLHRSALEQLPTGSRYLIKQDLADRSQISQALRHSVSEGSKIAGLAKKKAEQGQLGLTSIQIETLKMVSGGLSNQEIAKQRFVSEKAVEQTIKRLAERFGLSTREKNLRVELTKAYLKLTGGKS